MMKTLLVFFIAFGGWLLSMGLLGFDSSWRPALGAAYVGAPHESQHHPEMEIHSPTVNVTVPWSDVFTASFR